MVNEMKMNIFVCEEAPEISERNNIKKTCNLELGDCSFVTMKANES
jgi:hypothetical protein